MGDNARTGALHHDIVAPPAGSKPMSPAHMHCVVVPASHIAQALTGAVRHDTQSDAYAAHTSREETDDTSGQLLLPAVKPPGHCAPPAVNAHDEEAGHHAHPAVRAQVAQVGVGNVYGFRPVLKHDVVSDPVK